MAAAAAAAKNVFHFCWKFNSCEHKKLLFQSNWFEPVNISHSR